MHTPAVAIAWEIWSKNRVPLGIVAALLPLSFVLRALLWPEAVQLFEFFAVLATAVILFWAFSFAEIDARGRHTGFPARMFVLPVRTVQLVSYPVLYGMASILVFYFAWVGVLSVQWDLSLRRQTMLCQASVQVAMLVSMQAVVWALHRFNWTRMIVLTSGGTLAACFIVLSAEGEMWLNRKQLTGLAMALLAVAYAGVLVAVERDRRGNWLKWLEGFYQTFFDALPWRGKSFASPAQAQFWIEWTRRGWFMACVWALGMTMALVLMPLSSALYFDPLLTLISFCTWPILTLWLARCDGMQLGRSDAWSPEVTLHPITAMRPLTTGDVVFAKLKVAAAVTGLSWIGFALLALPAMQTARFYAHLNEDMLQFWSSFPAQHRVLFGWASNPVVILTAFGLTWHALVQGMCPVLLGQPRRHFWQVGLAMTFFGIAVAVAGWLYHHREQMPAFLVVLPWIAGAMLAWKWATAARGFAQGYGNGLYSRRQWGCVLAIWIALSMGVGFCAGLACDWVVPAPIIIFLSVWLLPGKELAVCAAYLARNRHR